MEATDPQTTWLAQVCPHSDQTPTSSLPHFSQNTPGSPNAPSPSLCLWERPANIKPYKENRLQRRQPHNMGGSSSYSLAQRLMMPLFSLPRLPASDQDQQQEGTELVTWVLPSTPLPFPTPTYPSPGGKFRVLKMNHEHLTRPHLSSTCSQLARHKTMRQRVAKL